MGLMPEKTSLPKLPPLKQHNSRDAMVQWGKALIATLGPSSWYLVEPSTLPSDELCIKHQIRRVHAWFSPVRDEGVVYAHITPRDDNDAEDNEHRSDTVIYRGSRVGAGKMLMIMVVPQLRQGGY